MDTSKSAMGPCPCLASLCHIAAKEGKEARERSNVRGLSYPCRQPFPGLIKRGGVDLGQSETLAPSPASTIRHQPKKKKKKKKKKGEPMRGLCNRSCTLCASGDCHVRCFSLEHCSPLLWLQLFRKVSNYRQPLSNRNPSAELSLSCQ